MAGTSVKQEPHTQINDPVPSQQQQIVQTAPQYSHQNARYYPSQVSNLYQPQQIAAIPQMPSYSQVISQPQYGFPPPGKY